jgi:hypothetical protein
VRTLAFVLAAGVGMPALGAGQQVALRHYTVADGLAHEAVTRVFQDSRGYIWFATADGVSRFDGHHFETYRSADGLPRSLITQIGETDGVLWVVARNGQAVRANDTVEGPRFLPHRLALTTTTVSAIVRRGTLAHARIFADRSFDAAPLIVRGTSTAVSDMIEDGSGNLWIATSGSGVFTAPAELVVSYTAADELPDQHILRIVESRDGRIYALTRRGGVAELRDDGVEAVAGSWFAPFHTIAGRVAQDDDGAWWFRTNAGIFTAPGPALSFATARPVTESAVRLPDNRSSSFTDSRRWLWEPLPEGGVSLCTERGCIDYASHDGIGHQVTSIAEDGFGRVYFGTNKGLIRYDPALRRFSGIPSGIKLAGLSITHCMRDSHGRMWISTTGGASYVVPRKPHSLRPPAVYLTGLTVGDAEVALPPRGISELATLEPGESMSMRIQFAAPSRSGAVRYQHRLAPIDNDWSGAGTAPGVTYASLRPGVYTFMVRAVALDGGAGPTASVHIRVAGGLSTWWWAVLLGAALSVGARSLRQFQRADGRRDLTCVPLRVLGGMEQQAEDGRRHTGTSDAARVFER